METPKVKCVKCIIHDGTVCSPSMVDEVLPTDTPATAIPNGRLAEVREAGTDVLRAIREKCSDYNDKVHPYNDDHHIEVTLTIGEIKRFHAALTLLGDTP